MMTIERKVTLSKNVVTMTLTADTLRLDYGNKPRTAIRARKGSLINAIAHATADLFLGHEDRMTLIREVFTFNKVR